VDTIYLESDGTEENQDDATELQNLWKVDDGHEGCYHDNRTVDLGLQL
jgi:hypothetical protein